MKSEPHRRKGIRIMGGLIGLVKPLLPVMFLAVLLGTLGYLCAIFLTILAGYGLLQLFFEAGQPGTLFAALGILAVLRGLFHYGEQYCNHFIAFKLLALIRHKVFAALRRLCPAKLEGKDKGNLISMITTDVELLEVFYAHTISPIAIAAAVSASGQDSCTTENDKCEYQFFHDQAPCRSMFNIVAVCVSLTMRNRFVFLRMLLAVPRLDRCSSSSLVV